MGKGIDRLITMDLHADQIQGFFNIPVDHLYASGIFLPYIQSLNLENLVIATPDVGGSKRASTYAKYLMCLWHCATRLRKSKRVVATMQIIGDVKDKNVILVDDMVDTAGTITKAADIMKERSHFCPRHRFSLCDVRSCFRTCSAIPVWKKWYLQTVFLILTVVPK